MLGAINFLFPKIKLKNNTFKHCTFSLSQPPTYLSYLVHEKFTQMRLFYAYMTHESGELIAFSHTLVFFLYQSCENGQVRKVVKIVCWIIKSHDFTILQHISNPNLTLQLGDVALWDRHANSHDRWNQRFLCVNSFPFCGAGSRPN